LPGQTAEGGDRKNKARLILQLIVIGIIIRVMTAGWDDVGFFRNVPLPLFGFILSTQYEFPALQKRWGGFEEMEKIRTYKQSDISNIKC
jgi:hypothetical protein